MRPKVRDGGAERKGSAAVGRLHVDAARNPQSAEGEAAELTGVDLNRLEEAGGLGQAFISGLPGAGLLVVDGDLRILRIEGAVYRELDRDAVLLRRVPDVVDERHWEALKPRYQAALDGNAQSFEYAAPGLASTYWVRLAPIRDDTSTVVGAMVLSHDITAQADARKRLAENERLQRSVLEVLEEGIITTDLHGRLVHANPAACSMLGIDLASAKDDAVEVGESATRALPPEPDAIMPSIQTLDGSQPWGRPRPQCRRRSERRRDRRR